MSEKYQNKYRTTSASATFWNYSNEGRYFITICTANRLCIFGDIIGKQMKLSPIGEIVLDECRKSFEIRTELFCDAFVLMPNHRHAVLRIDWKDEIDHDDIVDAHSRVHLQYLPGHSQLQNHGIAYRPPKSISSFVAGFKSPATKKINELRNTPKKTVWQPRFHDHIIRNDFEYLKIVNYINSNVENWNNDTFSK